MSSHLISLDTIENSQDKTLEYTFCDTINDINSDGPIEAELTFKSLGEFIEVIGDIKGTINLECDICLKEFKFELDAEIDEMFAKQALSDEYADETELKEGQFVTDLNGSDEIDIYDLLYQSVILNLPNKKVCGINCNGTEFLKEENLTDPRLDVFKNIKIEGEKEKG